MRPNRYPCFDALRILGALMVLFSHSFPLTATQEPTAFWLGDARVTLGTAGVILFFTASGFLVATSWTRSPRPVPYVVRRVLRIWPALIVVVVLTALVLGPLVTTLSRRQYLHDPGTWNYITSNLRMWPIALTLPGVFTTTPNWGVNGSLWTLPYEVLCYVALLVAGCLRVVRRPGPQLAFVALLVCHRLGVAHNTIGLQAGMGDMTLYYVVALGVWFAAGAVLADMKDRVVGQHRNAAFALIALVVGFVAGESLVIIPALAFLLIYVATLDIPAAEVVGRFGDPSYGLYLYAFPIQQTLIDTGVARMNPWLTFIEATPLALGCGYVSWHVVERPASRLSQRVGRRRRPTVAST